MSTEPRSASFLFAAINPMSFNDEQLFAPTDDFRGYSRLVDYDIAGDSDYRNIIAPKIEQALSNLHDFDKKCVKECEAKEIRYKFEPHSTNLAIETSEYLISKGCSGQAAGIIGIAMKLHDIGKIEVEAHNWHKAQKICSDAIKNERRRHTIYGSEIIRNWLDEIPTENVQLKEFVEFAADLAMYHHVGLEKSALWDKTLDQLPLSIKVAATIEGYDGHRLERDPDCSMYRTPIHSMSKMMEKCKQGCYDTDLARDYCIHRIEHPSPIKDIREAQTAHAKNNAQNDEDFKSQIQKHLAHS